MREGGVGRRAMSEGKCVDRSALWTPVKLTRPASAAGAEAPRSSASVVKEVLSMANNSGER
jgi:hypothetical protein